MTARVLASGLLAVLVLLGLTGAARHMAQARSAAPPARFFFAGDGHLVLQHAYFDTTLDVRYRRPDGRYDAAALGRIQHFFRSREDGREAPVSLRLIELLGFVEQRFHPRHMVLLSGYRSPEFNTDLRSSGRAVAQASLHTEAMAADVTFAGVDMARLWRQLRELHTGGVGFYRANKFLHIDTGPPRFWEATTSRVDENLSAGNARMFLRTDFDRYDSVRGAVCGLHSVTAFPLRIQARAELTGPNGTTAVSLEPTDGARPAEGGCFAITAPAERYEFRVAEVAGGAGVSPGRQQIVLSTCEPREGKTPAQVTSNPIEVLGR